MQNTEKPALVTPIDQELMKHKQKALASPSRKRMKKERQKNKAYCKAFCVTRKRNKIA